MRRTWVEYDEYLEGATTPPPHAPTGELESAAAAPCAIVIILAAAAVSFTLVLGTSMIYQSRAIEQYPTGIRALLAGVSGLLYRRSTWVAFFVETAAARSLQTKQSACVPPHARARSGPAVFGAIAGRIWFPGPWAVFGAVFVNTARISCSCPTLHTLFE